MKSELNRLLIKILFVVGFMMTPVCLVHASFAEGYTNPVLRGLNPDPSVYRVGNDYYLVTSSMSLYPGIPVYHSKDLIHWQRIGYCLTRPSQFLLDKNKNSPMMYAATIRYHDGRFYVITTDVGSGWNFFVTAKNPAGPWSDPILVDKGMFDPSLFFDDNGKVYFTRRGPFKDKDIVQAEIDIKTGKLLTPLRSISKGRISDDAEGPHLFKANGWYYLALAEGGSRALHMETISRSRSPWGPFQSDPDNPVIAQHYAWWHHLRTLGHADFVEAANGSQWAVCLGTRHYGYDDGSTIGRETFLFPVKWRNGWPYVEPKFMQYLKVESPTLPLKPLPKVPEKVNFDKTRLGLRWNMLSYPLEKYYSLTARPGWLRLIGNADNLSDSLQCAFIGCRQKEMGGWCETEMEFTPTAPNEEAGISVFQASRYHYDLFVTIRGGREVAVLRKTVGDMSLEAGAIPVHAGRIRLKVMLGPEKYTFLISQRDQKWEKVGTAMTNLISTEVAQVWSGALIGMYSSGNGKACRNPADFRWFDAHFKEVPLSPY